jgi:hypothetical protein
MIAGRRPFGGETNLDALISTSERAAAACELRAGAPLRFSGSSRRRPKEQDERYQTIKDDDRSEEPSRGTRVRSKREGSRSTDLDAGKDVTTPIQQLAVTGSAQAIPTSPIRKPRFVGAVIGALVVAVIGIVAVKFWLSSAPASSNAPPPPAIERVLNYWVTVQKYRDGRAYEEPFRLPGEINFEKHYRVRLHFGSPQDGHLYIFNEGPPSNGQVPPLNVLFPSPTANNGSSLVPGGQTVDIPKQSWFRFDQEKGTEKLWLVWSAIANPELECDEGVRERKGPGCHRQPGS